MKKRKAARSKRRAPRGKPARPRGSSVSAAAAPQSRLRFTQFAVDNLSDAAYWIEENARISYVNDAACRLTGYSRDELLRMRVYDLNPDVSRESWLDVWDSLKRARKRTFEARHRTKDGRVFPVEIAANFLEYRGKEYSCAFVRDITDRRQLEMRLRQAEKMEALGQLAGGIAHDFNNQLMGIQGYADVLRKRLAGQATLVELTDNIRDIVRRASELTSQLLAFSRKGMYVSRPVDLHRLITDVTHILTHSLDKKIVVRHRLEARDTFTMGDATQLQSAILNLALNARDAMPDGGTLSLATSNVRLPEGLDIDQLFPAPAGEYVRLTVSDNGAGMETETRRRAFEPFFTTKPTGKGTGLGLAAVYGTVRSHRGTLGIRSGPKQGTEIQMCLPVTRARPAEIGGASEALESRLATTRVVLVEDEATLRDVTRKMLEDLGCSVTTFENGETALRFYEDNFESVDVVILDMVMPVMNGRETFLAMRAVNPAIKALLASGYSLEGETREALEQGAKGFIQKPYDSCTLARKIVGILERRDPTRGDTMSTPLPTRPLGTDGPQITTVGFGAWAVGGGGWAFAWGPQDDEESIAAIRHAVRKGVSWIDTAAVYGYGHSEEVVGRAIAGIPPGERPLVFTKCGLRWHEGDPMKQPARDSRPARIREECEASLRRLGVERIDLYQFHWPDETGTPVEDSWGEMLRLVDEGKLRWVGVSNYDVPLLEQCQAMRPVQSLQPPFSMIRRRVAEKQIPWCADHGVGVIVYSPMQSGLLTDSFTAERVAAFAEDDWRRRFDEFKSPRLERNLALRDALPPIAAKHGTSTAAVAVAWTLAWPGVTGAIVGARSPRQVDGWIAAAHLTLDGEDLAAIAAAIEATGAGAGPAAPPRA